MVEAPSAWPERAGGGTAVADITAADITVAEPCVVVIDDEPQTRRHLEIVDLSDGGRVVTAIEFHSPGYKAGVDGQVAYLKKQREYREAKINLVEIDLIRVGDFVLAVPRGRIPRDYRTTYQVCVRRANQRDRAEIYRVPLNERLPNIAIPLRPSDADVKLQLQPLIDACYRDGRYHRVNYRADPIPRFGEEESLWTDRILREQGLRS